MVPSLKFIVPTAASMLLCAGVIPIVGANNGDGGYPITDDQIGNSVCSVVLAEYGDVSGCLCVCVSKSYCSSHLLLGVP